MGEFTCASILASSCIGIEEERAWSQRSIVPFLLTVQNILRKQQMIKSKFKEEVFKHSNLPLLSRLRHFRAEKNVWEVFRIFLSGTETDV